MAARERLFHSPHRPGAARPQAHIRAGRCGEAEHADEPEVEAILGFRPTHAVNVSAGCNREIDHVATALLTAAVMDVIGGVANVELLDGQASVVAGLPGVLGIAGDDWMALGSAEFLRAWVGHPAFRLVK
ncbi:DUF6368 family protein [Streptomyces sp. NPDC058914]|uniref:DUF6368 family protein n=1 Tax=Streptomyces sp. NPDC058914 TaxID=3346671 RepID=UPI0036AE8C47